jgi:hypothetical protein
MLCIRLSAWQEVADVKGVAQVVAWSLVRS